MHCTNTLEHTPTSLKCMRNEHVFMNLASLGKHLALTSSLIWQNSACMFQELVPHIISVLLRLKSYNSLSPNSCAGRLLTCRLTKLLKSHIRVLSIYLASKQLATPMSAVEAGSLWASSEA